MKRTLFLLVLVLTVLSACGTAPQPTPGPTLTPTVLPADTPAPSDTPAATLTPTPTLGVGSSQASSADGMLLVYVPEGAFLMGSGEGYSDEKPVHMVNLSAFWVDQTEVTNGMYALCVVAGVCTQPLRKSSNLIDYYYGFEEYTDYPVIFISWQDASNYCAWAGRRLPTEAEWEKAARGTDGRSYPWGSTLPDETLANFDHNLDDVTRVGSYLTGASPYGALDLAGNVSEWTADWYGEEYYASSPESNPPGPETGERRVVRGGSWTGNDRGVWSFHRSIRLPDSPAFDIGFRCVTDARP
ncbi:MAG: SUMF1/EgtB/PvdO family nonheme iron enzyme [Chloroflexi bacterium]|nr:SUMF1/EgtB/PvdO family nonheme iron enzyme [Chloroflexota bacterium]